MILIRQWKRRATKGRIASSAMPKNNACCQSIIANSEQGECHWQNEEESLLWFRDDASSAPAAQFLDTMRINSAIVSGLMRVFSRTGTPQKRGRFLCKKRYPISHGALDVPRL